MKKSEEKNIRKKTKNNTKEENDKREGRKCDTGTEGRRRRKGRRKVNRAREVKVNII